jgi:hypothetical protein
MRNDNALIYGLPLKKSSGPLLEFFDNCDDGTKLDGIAFPLLDLSQDSVVRGFNLDIDLVGLNFEERLVPLKRAPGSFQSIQDSDLLAFVARSHARLSDIFWS